MEIYDKIKQISIEKFKIHQDKMNNVYLNMADEFIVETSNSMKNNVFESLLTIKNNLKSNEFFSEIDKF